MLNSVAGVPRVLGKLPSLRVSLRVNLHEGGKAPVLPGLFSSADHGSKQKKSCHTGDALPPHHPFTVASDSDPLSQAGDFGAQRRKVIEHILIARR